MRVSSYSSASATCAPVVPLRASPTELPDVFREQIRLDRDLDLLLRPSLHVLHADPSKKLSTVRLWRFLATRSRLPNPLTRDMGVTSSTY